MMVQSLKLHQGSFKAGHQVDFPNRKGDESLECAAKGEGELESPSLEVLKERLNMARGVID